ncbi:hypothetical protein AB0L06_09210 [Spirillospora sp. NPDC052269]
MTTQPQQRQTRKSGYAQRLRECRMHMYSELVDLLPALTPPLTGTLIGGADLLRVTNPSNGRSTVVMTTEVQNRAGRAWGYFWQNGGHAWTAEDAAFLLARWLR